MAKQLQLHFQLLLTLSLGLFAIPGFSDDREATLDEVLLNGDSTGLLRLLNSNTIRRGEYLVYKAALEHDYPTLRGHLQACQNAALKNGSKDAAWNCGYMLSNVHLASGDARKWLESMRKLQMLRPQSMPKGSDFSSVTLPGEFHASVPPGKTVLPSRLAKGAAKSTPVQTIEITINASPVDAIVDSGWLDTVVVSRKLANRLGLRELAPFAKDASTDDPLSKVVIPELKLGSMTLINVLSSVVETNKDDALIGLRILERFDRVKFEPGEITFDNEVNVSSQCRFAAPIRFIADQKLRTHYVFDVIVNNVVKIPTIFDSGGQVSLAVDHNVLDGKVSLPPMQRISAEQWGRLATTTMASRFPATVEIAGANFHFDPILALDRATKRQSLYGAFLGAALLPKYDVTMDFAQMRLCIDPRS